MVKSPILKNELGLGIYTMPDIHLILGYPLYKIRRYIKKYWDNFGKSKYNDTYSFPDKKNRKVVNFYVLMELYTFFQLLEKGINTKRVVKARKDIAKALDTPYPFANRKFLVKGQTIWHYLGDVLVDSETSTQTHIVEAITSFAEKIEFENNLAKRFYPLNNTKNIVVDPHHQFGQPVINGRNIVTETIFSMYKSGEEKESLAILYNISEQQINDAIYFHEQSLKKAA